MLSYEGTTVGGTEGITGALGSIPVPDGEAHAITSSDVQPSPLPGALLVFLTGDLCKTKFQQVFHLVPTDDGSFYIHNDIFRVTEENAINAPSELGGDIAKAFVEHYYATFDGDRINLAALYRNESMLTMEGTQHGTDAAGGVEGIMERLAGLPQVKHDIATLDVQPVAPDGKAVLVFVTGKMLIEGSDNPLLFAQTFVLVKVDGTDGEYYVHNDVFRFNYG